MVQTGTSKLPSSLQVQPTMAAARLSAEAAVAAEDLAEALPPSAAELVRSTRRTTDGASHRSSTSDRSSQRQPDAIAPQRSEPAEVPAADLRQPLQNRTAQSRRSASLPQPPQPPQEQATALHLLPVGDEHEIQWSTRSLSRRVTKQQLPPPSEGVPSAAADEPRRSRSFASRTQQRASRRATADSTASRTAGTQQPAAAVPGLAAGKASDAALERMGSSNERSGELAPVPEAELAGSAAMPDSVAEAQPRADLAAGEQLSFQEGRQPTEDDGTLQLAVADPQGDGSAALPPPYDGGGGGQGWADDDSTDGDGEDTFVARQLEAVAAKLAVLVHVAEPAHRALLPPPPSTSTCPRSPACL